LEESTSKKCEATAEKDDQQWEAAEGVIDIHLPDPLKETEPLKLKDKPVSKESQVIRPVSLLDITVKNSGPICPPKTSCMRLARNSYFS